MQHFCAPTYVLQTKDLRKYLSSLDATLAKNRGWGPTRIPSAGRHTTPEHLVTSQRPEGDARSRGLPPARGLTDLPPCDPAPGAATGRHGRAEILPGRQSPPAAFVPCHRYSRAGAFADSRRQLLLVHRTPATRERRWPWTFQPPFEWSSPRPMFL